MNTSKTHGLIAASVAALDQVVKMQVRSLPLGNTFFEVPGLVTLEHCVNTGAAFSMFSGRVWLLTMISAVLIVMMLFYAHRHLRLTPLAWIAVECLIGGGIGNLLDRVLFSGVTDYIRLRMIDFPVFNLADVAITVSVAVLLVLLFTDTLEEHVEEKNGSEG